MRPTLHTPAVSAVTMDSILKRLDPIAPQGAPPPMAMSNVATEPPDREKTIPWDASLQPAESLSAAEQGTIGTVMDSPTVRRRNAVLAVLEQVSPFPLHTVDLKILQEAGYSCFQAEPRSCRLGEALV